MKQRNQRILYTLAAFILGIGLVLGLSFAGNKSKGPIENILTKASTAVTTVEENIIIAQKEEKRADKLAWLQPYKKNVSLLKHPKVILLGAFDNQISESLKSILSLEDSLKTNFPIVQIYTAWGSKEDQHFPAKKIKAINELGSIPLITWEPWLTDFDAEKHPELPAIENRDHGGLMDIATGKYDFYLTQWASEAKKSMQPFFLRLGHEMNDPYRYPWGPQNNAPKDFIAAWQHVHQVFAKAGASNVVWVWSPHPAYGAFKDYYPGNDYVDYVGVGTLNYGNVASWSQWWSFADIFGKYYNDLQSFGKPILLTEFGSLAAGGNRAKWYAEALHTLPKNYPAVKGVLFFHFSEDNTTTQQTLNWYFKNDKAVTKAIVNELKEWPATVKPTLTLK